MLEGLKPCVFPRTPFSTRSGKRNRIGNVLNPQTLLFTDSIAFTNLRIRQDSGLGSRTALCPRRPGPLDRDPGPKVPASKIAAGCYKITSWPEMLLGSN